MCYMQVIGKASPNQNHISASPMSPSTNGVVGAKEASTATASSFCTEEISSSSAYASARESVEPKLCLFRRGGGSKNISGDSISPSIVILLRMSSQLRFFFVITIETED